MTTDELRRGNWVDAPGNLKHPERYFAQVTIIHDGEYISIDQGQLRWSPRIEDVKAIPITEEWLIRFGINKTYTFVTASEWEIAGLSNYILVLTPNSITLELCCGEFTEAISIMRYIHQLQNLYFALIGEELVLNEKA